METREQRGQAIADQGKLRQKGILWVVPSQNGHGSYVVEPDAITCTCPDFEARADKCKHLFAVEYTIQRETNAQGETKVTESVRLTYSQDWPAYNAAQTVEKERVATFLHGLCSAIDNPVHENGRPPLPLSDAVFCAVMKVYGGTSGRRAMTDMREYAEQGYIDKAPHYNSIFNVMENPVLTPILKAMIEESAKPLRGIETDFAVDASGFSTSTYARWFDHKYGKTVAKNEWLKAHVMIGTTTNVVTSVEVTPGKGEAGPVPWILSAWRRKVHQWPENVRIPTRRTSGRRSSSLPDRVVVSLILPRSFNSLHKRFATGLSRLISISATVATE